ncbi:MAG TPA: undecaprenyl-phosphate glucose phosphotransferase [Chloroflexota bacterium]|nr:undecaprenyl-phosphate glucose phosphotransferase [Chloroflexota bacterium]
MVGIVRGLSGLRGLYVLALIVSDLVMLRLAFVLAYRMRLLGDTRPGQPNDPPATYDDLALLCVLAIMVIFAIRRLYIPRRGFGRVDLLYQVSAAVGVGWLAALSFTFFVYRALEPPRLMLVYWALLSIGLVWLTRVVLDALLREAHRRGRDLVRVLIVGDGEQAQLVEAKIRAAPELGYRVAGFIGNGAATAVVRPVLGGLADIPTIVRDQHVGEVIIAWAGISHIELVDIVTGCTRQRVDIKIFPDIFELMAREVETSELTGLPLMRVRDVALRGWMRFLKRALDVAVSWTLLVLLSWWFLIMAALVKLTSPNGPVLHVQERVGLDGRPFYMLKFRSMRPDAEAESGPVWATPNDPRRTPVGGVIRRFSLDEFPQLINVLVGEMSLVGPRPERPEFVAQFANLIPRYRERHMEKAGMTGWAQVNGLRGQTSIVERTEYDLFYVETWSLAFDIKILLKTLAAVIRDRNAY